MNDVDVVNKGNNAKTVVRCGEGWGCGEQRF